MFIFSLKLKPPTTIRGRRFFQSSSSLITQRSGHKQMMKESVTHLTPVQVATKYTLCDDHKTTKRAYEVLRAAPYLLLDCEGHRTGFGTGSDASLSVVQMGTPHAKKIFLFDMLTLRESSRKKVLSLIADPHIPKIGWGLRTDFETLSRGYKTPINSFLDLQIVDIHSRIRRRESVHKQILRLASAVFPISALAKLEIEGVHALNGMDAALLEHGINSVPLKESVTSRWHKRPLPRALLRYASGDINRISALYEHFKKSGDLQVKTLPTIILHSVLYASFDELNSSSSQSNILPLGILNKSVDDSTFFNKNKDLRKCEGCHRVLPHDCFSLPSSDRNTEGESAAGDKSARRLPTCRVCVVLMKKERYILANAANKAAEYLKRATAA